MAKIRRRARDPETVTDLPKDLQGLNKTAARPLAIALGVDDQAKPDQGLAGFECAMHVAEDTQSVLDQHMRPLQLTAIETDIARGDKRPGAQLSRRRQRGREIQKQRQTAGHLFE